MRRLVSHALAALTLVATIATGAFAQNTVILTGVVRSEGQPIVDAQVTITNVATQETARAVTRANGEFRVLGLFTGQYAVTVRAIGYKPTGQKVQLAIGQRARLEFNMEKGVAELAAQTIIGEKVKQVEVQRLSVSAPVMRAEIENLPLNARGLMNLAGVAPGIKTYAPQSGRTLPSAGGAPDNRFFNVYVDGVEMKSLYNGNIVGLGQTGSPLPQEALEQFRVFVNPYDAEYSRAGSYVISTESRRGTNKWEGSAFGFLQNKAMITQNAFQKKVPDYSRQQLGFNLRGPLKKDKLFLATSYELTNTNFYLDVNPTSGPWSQYQGSFLAPNKNHTLFGRLTYVQSPTVTYDAMVSARLLDGEGNFGAKVSQDGGISQNYDIYTAQLRQRYLKPGGNFVNEASLQLVSWGHKEAPLKPGPQFNYPGISFGTSGFPLFLNELHLRVVDRSTWNIDNASGSHTIKSGIELASISASQDFANNANGTFTFLTDTSSMPYLANIAVGFTSPNTTEDAKASADAIVTGVYVNDEWRIKDNFTLSIGVRHDAELNTMNNKYMVPWASDTTLQRLEANNGPLAGFLNRGDRKNQLGNFSPRVSFSWDPTRQNRTFVRGGVGIIYDRVTSFMGFQERKNSTWRVYNFTFNNTTNTPTKDPAVLRQRVLAGQSGSPAPILMKHDMKTPKNLQMSLGIGHQFTEQFGINVDYVRQHLTNLYVQRNPNYTDKSVTPSARKLTSRYGDIVLWDDIGEAWYSAFLVSSTYQRNKTRVNLAYTLAWYEGSFDISGALPNYALPFLFDRQRTSGDERHRLVLSTVTPIPFGFNISAIATIASPRPFLQIDGRDVNLDNITGDDWPGGTRTTVGQRTALPANAFPNYYRTVDMRLARQLYAIGGKKVSFSAEVFNLFNWYNKLSYGGTQFTATGTAVPSFGVATGAYAARQMQAGLRVDW
jgi:hypothetical protein